MLYSFSDVNPTTKFMSGKYRIVKSHDTGFRIGYQNPFCRNSSTFGKQMNLKFTALNSIIVMQQFAKRKTEKIIHEEEGSNNFLGIRLACQNLLQYSTQRGVMILHTNIGTNLKQTYTVKMLELDLLVKTILEGVFNRSIPKNRLHIKKCRHCLKREKQFSGGIRLCAQEEIPGSIRITQQSIWI